MTGSDAPSVSATLLVFSMDRAAQADQLLRSIRAHVRFPHAVHVLYRASETSYAAGYERLFAEHDHVVAHDEATTDVDIVLRRVLAAADTSLFGMCVDDDVMIRDVRADDAPLRRLTQDPHISCASLRLAPHKTWSQTHGRPMQVPRIDDGVVDLAPRRSLPERGARKLLRALGVLSEARKAHHGCWRVPFSVCGNLYRTERFQAFCDKLPPFEHVTSVEPQLGKRRRLWGGPMHTAIYDEERLVNVVMNNVDTQGARYPHPGHSVADMNARYLEGGRLDLTPYDNGTFSACHVEAEPCFV